MKTAVAALSLAVLASLPTGAAAQKTFTMKLSTPSLNDVNHEFMKALKTSVEQRAGGRIKVELYPASQLGQLPRTIEGVQLGTIEMEFPAVGFLVGLEPRYIVFDAPGLFDNVVHGHQVFNDPAIKKRVATFGEAKGVEALFMTLNGPLMLVSHKPVRQVSDLKGQKIRVPGGAPMHIEPFRKLGVSPITMPLGDVLPAMQNRALDGMTSGFNIMNSFKYFDIAKAATELPGQYLVGCALVNRAFFKSLGDLEPMVREEAARHERLYSTWGVEDLGRIRASWEKNGGQTLFMNDAEKKRYVSIASSALPEVIGGNKQMKEDYDALVAAARKYRK